MKPEQKEKEAIQQYARRWLELALVKAIRKEKEKETERLLNTKKEGIETEK